MSAVAQLCAALDAIQAEVGDDWLDVLAAEVVRRGGGDAVDLLQIALDRELATAGPDASEAERN